MNKPYLWRVMRLLLLFLLAGFMHVAASSSAQTVSLKTKSIAFEELINVIRQQTDFEIYVNIDYLKGTRPVSVEAENMPVAEFLEVILRDQPLEAKIENNNIILYRRDVPEKSGAPRVPAHSSGNLVQAHPVVRGVVVDAEGRPLSGATIRVLTKDGRRTTLQAQTDAEGIFVLREVPNDAQVEISFMGHISQIVPAGANIGKIVLQAVVSELEAVVVSTGYQEIPRERATGSYATVSNEILSRKPTMNIIDRLEGLAGGLVFHRNSVDEEPRLVVRGRSTIYGNDQPLVVVDGFPIEGDLSNVNPNDVQDITILRDAAAASIWGVRAANGVIVITTRRGQASQINERPIIEVRSQLLMGEKPDLFYLPFMSTSDYIDLELGWYEQGRFDGHWNLPPDRQPVVSPVIGALLDVEQGYMSAADAEAYINRLRDVDVRREYGDLFYRNRAHQQHMLNIRGATERTRYLFSAGYDQDRSAERGNSNERITLRADNTYLLTKNLQLHASLNHTWSSRKRNGLGLYGFQGETGSSFNSASGDQFAFYPYQELLDENGNAITLARRINGRYNALLQEQYGMLDWGFRPADEIHQRNNGTHEQYTRLATSLEYSLPAGFRLDLRYQYERNSSQHRNLQTTDLYSTRHLINTFTQILPDGINVTNHVPVGDILLHTDGSRLSHSFRGQVNYNGAWADNAHVLAAIAGTEVRDITDKSRLNSYYGYNDRTLQYTDLNKTEAFPQFGQPFSRPFNFGGGVVDDFDHIWNRYASFYANGSYTYLGRYVLSASGRMDKSSLFGVRPEDRNVPLWSAGAAWNLGEESFVNMDNLSELRLRATYGYNGNVNPAQTAFPIAFASRDPMTNLPAARVSSPANPILQWEKVRQINLAIDFGLWNHQLSGRLEWFGKQGQDLFGDHFLDPSSGFSTIRANVASMRGQGLDFELNYRTGKELRWSTKLLFSHAVDKVTDIALADAGSGPFGGPQSYMQADRRLLPLVDRPVYALYSYHWAGLDDEGNPQLYDENGEIGNYVQILNGLAPGDLQYHGPAQPTFFGGWTHNVYWKGFGLTTTFTYKFGHYFRRSSINYYGLNSTSMTFRSTGHSDYARRWQRPGDELHTDVPALVGYPQVADAYRDEAYRYSGILIEDASHIRLKDISLSYDLTGRGLRRTPFRSAQLYLYVDNVSLPWKANDHGIDPDFVPQGYSNYLPLARTFTFGVNIEL